jgi:hypothetical protein
MKPAKTVLGFQTFQSSFTANHYNLSLTLGIFAFTGCEGDRLLDLLRSLLRLFEFELWRTGLSF